MIVPDHDARAPTLMLIETKTTQELHLLGPMRWMRLRRSLRPNQHRPTLLVPTFLILNEECYPPTSSRSVQQLLASHPVGDPFWGGHDHTDGYSVDTADSAQDLVGFHAYAEENYCTEDKEILAIDEEREEARLIALDQQRLDELLGPDATNKGSEDINEETARLIAVKTAKYG